MRERGCSSGSVGLKIELKNCEWKGSVREISIFLSLLTDGVWSVPVVCVLVGVLTETKQGEIF